METKSFDDYLNKRLTEEEIKEEAKKEIEMKWISVEDQMPPFKEPVLLYTDVGIFEGFCKEESWINERYVEEPRIIIKKNGKTYVRRQMVLKKNKESGVIFHTDVSPFEDCCRAEENFSVTHWMPLPLRPDETKDKE